MPNWVYNTLSINKNSAFRVLDKENNVDFNLAKPMPKSLDREENSYCEYEIYYYLSNKLSKPLDDMRKMDIIQTLIKNSFDTDWLQTVYNRLVEYTKTDTFDSNKTFENGKTLVDNYTKYGATTWYGWSIANWGCKWNASNTEVEDDYDDANKLIIRFDTPWSPPEGWCQALAEMKIKFECEWVEEQGYHGMISSDGVSGQIECQDLEFISDDDYDDEENEEDNSNPTNDTSDSEG